MMPIEEVIEKYGKQLWSVCERISLCEADAEDAYQEALLKIHTKQHTFEGRCSFFSWLYRIAHNSALEVRRYQKRRTPPNAVRMEDVPRLVAESPELDFSLLYATGPEGDPHQAAVVSQLRSRLSEACSSLSETTQAILYGCYVLGNTSFEQGRESGMVHHTIKNRMYHDRARLRKRLADYANYFEAD